MLRWLVVGCVATAVVVAARWWLRRYDALGRRRPYPYWSTGLCMTLALAGVVPIVRHGRLEDRLSAVASALAGTRVHVHCETAGEAFVDAGAEAGYVRFGPDGVPEHKTVLKYDACSALSRYLGSAKRAPSEAQVGAVHVLTHETMHMRGETAEALAECQAMQRDARTAMLLGATRVQALALAARYWRDDYPRMPDEYRINGCAPGAALDERLPDPPWPL